MKKKYLNVALALLTCAGLMSMTGCGKKDPFTVYTDAAKKTAQLSSMEMDYDINMTLDLGGESMDISTSSNAKMSGINTDDMKISMAMKVSSQGQENDMNVYYTDGYYYTDTIGVKMKYAMDLEQAQKEVASTGIQTDLKKEDFKEISMDKDQVITFTIDGEKMDSIVDSAMTSLQGLVSSSDASVDIGDVSGTASVNKDGYFEKSTMTIPVTMDIMGTEMKISMDMDYTYVNPGKEAKPELPDDLTDYQEIDMDALGTAPIAEGEEGTDAKTEGEAALEDASGTGEEAA